MRYLTRNEYELVLHQVLRRAGVDTPTAEKLMSARWPMGAAQLISEADARGLSITSGDIKAWLREAVGQTWPDGQPVTADSAMFSPERAEECLAWCVRTGRARPNTLGRLFERDFSVIEKTYLRPAQMEMN